MKKDNNMILGSIINLLIFTVKYLQVPSINIMLKIYDYSCIIVLKR